MKLTNIKKISTSKRQPNLKFFCRRINFFCSKKELKLHQNYNLTKSRSIQFNNLTSKFQNSSIGILSRPFTINSNIKNQNYLIKTQNHIKNRNFSSPDSDRKSITKNPKLYFKYCQEIVEDYEGNLWISMIKNIPAKNSIVAIRAFNSLLSGINSPTEEEIAEGKPDISGPKFEWWKEQINEIYQNRPPEHPIALALRDSIHYHHLTKIWFQKLINSRAQDQNRLAAFSTLNDLEKYAEQTQSSMLYLALESLSVKDPTADHIASHIGKAWGIVTLIRGTPFHSKNRKCYLPLDLMAQHRISQETVYQQKDTKELTAVTYELANHAYNHLELARSKEHLASQLKTKETALPAFLPATIIDDYLKRLTKANFQIFSDPQLTTVKHAGRALFILPKMFKNRFLNKY